MVRHRQVCGVRIIEQSLPSIYLSMAAYPVESTSRHAPAVPPLERNSGATAGELKCLPAARDMPL
jgi:hypothetical protein